MPSAATTWHSMCSRLFLLLPESNPHTSQKPDAFCTARAPAIPHPSTTASTCRSHAASRMPLGLYLANWRLQSAALNLIEHGINVNAIAPGVVDGEHWDGVDAFFAKYEGKAPGQKKREVGAAVPFGRMGTADDLTGMAIFLASTEADYVVAQTYNVDGGSWMS